MKKESANNNEGNWEINREVPFFPNTSDNTHCFQATFQMALKHFLPEKDFTMAELEAITGKGDRMWTWPFAGLLWLQKEGFDIRTISDFDLQRFANEGINYIEVKNGKEIADIIAKHGNIAEEQKRAMACLEKIEQGMYQMREASLADIRQSLTDNYLVICGVNSLALICKPGYIGHFLLIKGINEHEIIAHNPGLPPQENQRIPIDVFERAWESPNPDSKNIIAIKK
jgi:hypothetical protein